MASYCFKRYIVGHKIKHKPKVKKGVVENLVEEEVEYSDEFVDIANKALDTSIKYKYVVFAMIFVAIAIAGTLAFMDSSKKKKINTLSQEFSKALSVYNAEVIPNSQAEGQFKSTKEKLNKAIEEFNSFIAAHPNTKLSNIMNMYIGNAYYQLNDFDNAIKSYDLFLSSNDDNNLKELISLKKAEILNDNKKNTDKAIEVYKSLKDSKNEYIASISLYKLANIFKTKKDNKSSKKFIDELNKKFPKSYYALKLNQDNKL